MTIRIKSKRLLLAASMLCSVSVLGLDMDFDESDLLELYADDETVSISTGTNKPIRLAPSVATVITEEDISRSGATTLDELLEMVPGLHVSASKNNIMNPIYSIRGIHTSQNAQVLLLIDGTPIRQIFNGGRPGRFTWPVNNIKRIEVIRGPGSAVFGADAFSGVINVISKGALDIDGIVVGARAGSFNSKEIWAQYGKKLDNDWHIASSLEYTSTDGDEDRIVEADIQTFVDGLFGINASHAPGPLSTDFEVMTARVSAQNDSWNLSFLTWQQFDAGVADGILRALDPEGSFESEYYILDISRRHALNEYWKLEAKLSLSYFEALANYNLLPPGTIVPILNGNISQAGATGIVLFTDGIIGNPGGEEQKHSLELAVNSNQFDRHSIRLSAGFERQDGEATEAKNFGPGVLVGDEGVQDGTLTDVTNTPFIYVQDRVRDIWFLSAQDEWSLANDWILTAGIRYDDYSDFGSTINPRLALVWATSYNLSTKFLYGRAFRAPSMLEQLSENNPLLIGNPDIEPETIDTYEIAFDYQPSVDLSLNLNLYYYSIDDLINFVGADSLPIGAEQAQNAFSQDGHGFEFEFEYSPANNFSINGSYAWQDSEIGEPGSTVADAPQQQLFVELNWDPAPNWEANAQVYSIFDREREPGDMRDDIDDYTFVNTSFRRKNLFRNWELAISVRNLFDESAHTPSSEDILGDYPLPGRSIMIEINYHH